MSMLRKIVGSLWVAGMLLFAPIALAQDPSVKIYGVYNPNGYHEGEPAKFLLRCSADCRGKTINIKTSEVHSTGGQMLVSPGTTGVALSSATDSAPRFNDGRRHIVSVATQDDGIAGARSLVRAEIVAGTGYTRGAPWRAQRTYRDNSTARGTTTSIGTVRIQPYPAEVNMGSEVRFRLTSDRSISQDVPITIHVGADHGGLLDNPPTSITMSAGQRFAVLSVPTNSVTLTQDATINVLVTPTADYAVLAGERQIAEVTVKAPLPVVSFESLTDEVHAGDSIGFIVKRNVLSGEPLDVRLNYNFSGARHFILPGQPSSRTLTIPANELEVYDSVPTQVTDRTERDGTFKVTLLPISRVYGVTTTPTKTVTIRSEREPRLTLRSLSSTRIPDGGSIRVRVQREGNSTVPLRRWLNLHEDVPTVSNWLCVATVGRNLGWSSCPSNYSVEVVHHPARLVSPERILVELPAGVSYKDVTILTKGEDILPNTVICAGIENPGEPDPFGIDHAHEDERSCDNAPIRYEIVENDKPEFAIEASSGSHIEGAEKIVFTIRRTPSAIWEERTVRVSFETSGPYWTTANRPATRDLTFGVPADGGQGFYSDAPNTGYTEQRIEIDLPDNELFQTDSRIRARLHTANDYTVLGEARTPYATVIDQTIDEINLSGPESIREGQSATFTLSRERRSRADYDVHVSYVVQNPSHAEVLKDITVRMPRNALQARFSVRSTNDVYANGDGEIQAVILDGTNRRDLSDAPYVGDRNLVTVVVTDDEATSRLPVASISRLTSTITEGDDARFRISRSGPTTHPLYVNMWVSETGDTYGSFCSNPGWPFLRESVLSRTISIPEQPLGPRECLVGVDIPTGKSYLDIAIPTYGDTFLEEDSTITVEISDGRPEHFTRSSRHTATVLVRDVNLTNTAALRMSSSYTSADRLVEGSGDAVQFRIEKLCCTGRRIRAKLEITGGEGYFQSVPRSVDVPSNADHIDVSIPLVDDNTPNADKTVEVKLVSDPTYIIIGPDNTTVVPELTFTVKLRSDDPWIEFTPQITSTAMSVAEGSAFSLMFKLSENVIWRDEAQTNIWDAEVKYKTVAGTATAGTDYTEVAQQSVTVDATTGSARRHTITVDTTTDTVDDAGETFQVVIWSDHATKSALLRTARTDTQGNTVYDYVDRVTLTVTITNDGSLPKAWVAESAHAMGTASVDRIIDRLYHSGADKDGGWADISRSRIDGSDITASMDHSMVGVDHLLDDDLRFGIAIAGHRGEGKYMGVDGEYDLGSDMVGVYPYLQWHQSDTWQFWGIAGRASGDIEVANGSTFRASTRMTSELLALGGKGYLLGDRNDALTLTSATDAMWVWAASENARGMHAAKSRSYRYRNILELGYTLELGDASVRPTAAVESEYHGGDIEERKDITGIAGVEWVRDQLGVSFTTTLLDETEQELEIAYEGERWEVAVRADEDRRLAGRVAWNRTNRLTPYAGWASGQWEVGQSMALGETSDLSMYVSHDDAARAGVQIRLNW